MNRTTFRGLTTALCLLFLLCVPSLASADSLTWTLSGVVFDDGGKASGSFGPTTAGRMDSYVDLLQSKGASMIMIAKGNRSQKVTDACKKYGGFYLGSIGGPAAVLAEENIKKVECIDFPELGMEAVWKIEVENFPAFILVDDKGNDFFKQLGL